jgi:hypothetical protein
MSIERDIDSSVYSIRQAVQSIRDSIDTSDIDSDLDLIENECDELSNLEEDDPDIIVSNALDDMGLENVGEQWSRIEVGTANELREAVTRIFNEDGYSVG